MPFNFPEKLSTSAFQRRCKLVLFTLAIGFLYISYACAQGSMEDSIQALIEDVNEPLQRAVLLQSLATNLKDKNPMEAVRYGKEALEIFQKNNDPLQSKSSITLSIAYANMGDVKMRDKYLNMTIGKTQNAAEQAQVYALLGRSHFGKDSMFIYYDKYFQTCLENNLTEEMPNAYSQLGVMCAMRGDYPCADSLWRLGLEVTNTPKHNISRQGLLYNLCILNMQNAQYEEVFKFATEGYDLTKKSKNLNTELGFLNMLSKVSSHNLDTVEAYRYLLEGYNVIKANNLNSTVATDIVYSLARFYLGIDSLSEAIEISQKLVNMSEVNGRLDDRANGYGVLGLAAMKGDVQDQAISNIKLSLADTASLRGQPLLNGIFQNAAVIYHKYKKYPSALVLLNQIQQNLQQNYNLDADKSAQELFYKVFRDQGRNNDALLALERFKKLSDEQKDLTTTNKLMESKVKFDSERKQYQLDKSVIEIKLLAAKNDARKKQMLFGGLGLIGLFSLIYLFKSWKDIRKTAALQASFSQGLIRTQEDERKRVARDLHDGVGQKLMLLSKQTMSSGNVAMANLASQSLNEIRSISRGLHPSNLETLGFSQAVRAMIDEVDQHADLFITHDIDDIDKYLKNEASLHLFRIIQESLNNIVKHANAKASTISVKVIDQEIVAIIEDNGIGFDLEKGKNLTSLGMKTLQERALMIDGKLCITSKPGLGTKVEVKIST